MRIIAPCLLCGKDTITEQRPIVCYDCREKDISTQDMKMGKEWRENSSLEKWFPFTASELAALRKRNEELYALVESYLCAPNNDPISEDYYRALVAWFTRNKRPDGSKPRPVAPEHFRDGDGEYVIINGDRIYLT